MVNKNPVGNYVQSFGGSLGQRVSANSNMMGGSQRVDTPGAATVETDTSQVETAARIGASGNVTFSWVVMAILFAGLMFAGQKLGSAEGNFGSIKLSAYNVVIITLCVIVGVPLFKAFFTKFPIPGVTAIVMSV